MIPVQLQSTCLTYRQGLGFKPPHFKQRHMWMDTQRQTEKQTDRQAEGGRETQRQRKTEIQLVL